MKIKPLSKYEVNPESPVADPEENDYIAQTIGAFGTWQAIIWLIAIAGKFVVIANVILIVFLTPKTDFKCIKFRGDVNEEVQNSTCYENCIEYEYHNSLYKDTLITRFDLVCGDAWLASFAQSILMLGLLVGVPVIGWISDRFGRAFAFRLTTVIAAGFMIATAFAPTYWTFAALRFFVGFGVGGIVPLTVIICVESVGMKYKDLAGVASICADGVAQIILTVIAYYSPTCYIMILSCGLLSISIFTSMFVIPETPRWLIANQKRDEAIELLTKIARINNRDDTHIKDVVDKTLEKIKRDRKEDRNMTFLDLFATKQMSIITFNSIAAWTLFGVSYYGINHYSTLLGSEIHVVVAIMGLFELLASIFTSIINRRMRRKTSLVCALTVCGIAMLILIVIPDGHWACIAIIAVAFTAASSIFCIIYVQVNELYPTTLRNMGFALCSGGIKLGAMVAPFIANLEPHWAASAIFALVPFVTIAFCLPLPETKGKSLEDVVK